ncbi:hypothetical protein R3P38DRAFT_2788133 [Favolaschia claudopus]|uniref:Uncharacterized protein n=1 Tax=Favolaschia claudopus TaxID=2862362 RepID=A0AAW0AN66_9AGAR
MHGGKICDKICFVALVAPGNRHTAKHECLRSYDRLCVVWMLESLSIDLRKAQKNPEELKRYSSLIGLFVVPTRVADTKFIGGRQNVCCQSWTPAGAPLNPVSHGWQSRIDQLRKVEDGRPPELLISYLEPVRTFHGLATYAQVSCRNLYLLTDRRRVQRTSHQSDHVPLALASLAIPASAIIKSQRRLTSPPRVDDYSQESPSRLNVVQPLQVVSIFDRGVFFT